MEISLTELQIIIDTLIGSTNIADGGTHWKFNGQQRADLANILLNRLESIKLKIEISA